MKRPFIIGLTGGIGSGKSTVARIFTSLGFIWYQADQVAKQLYHTDQNLRRSLEETFGKQVYRNDQIDREYLAQIVFRDKDALEKLNKLVHPAVKRHFDDFKIANHQSIIVREAAILFESGSNEDCDLTITVSCPEETRIERVQKRDGLTREAILERLKNQMTDIERAEKADEELTNDGQTLLIPQVTSILTRHGVIWSMQTH